MFILDLSPIATSCVTKPIKLIVSVLLAGAAMEKSPEASVTAVSDPPLTAIVAPDKGFPPASLMRPVTLCCANTISDRKINRKLNSKAGINFKWDRERYMLLIAVV